MEHKHSLWYEMLLTSTIKLIPDYYVVKKALQTSPLKGKRPCTNLVMPIKFLNLNNLQVRYAENKFIEGRETILFLSTLPQSLLVYNPLWIRFSDRYNLIALDLPSAGKTESLPQHMCIEGMGEFIHDFVALKKLSDFHIVGPDIGMGAALGYAILQSDHKAKSLMIGDGPSMKETKKGTLIASMVRSEIVRRSADLMPELIIDLFNKICFINYKPSSEERQDYIESYEDGKMLKMLEWFKNYKLSSDSIDDQIEKLDMPINIFWGKYDALLPVESAYRLHQRLPRSTLNILEHAGHFSYLDDYVGFGDLLEHWVESGYREI